MVLPTKRFQKHKEDFTCANCGKKVTGTGYTDHCPDCLYSKHVDINPGDRANICQGMMKPIGIEGSQDKQKIVYRCEKCHEIHRVKVAANDNLDTIIVLTAGSR